MVRSPIRDHKDEGEARLAARESLTWIARTFGVTPQTMEYHRRIWGGKPLGKPRPRGEKHATWTGGQFVDWRGYRMIRFYESDRANPYTPEHILVAERILGRALANGEVVHHKNGDKLDNRPENLEVLSRPEHRQIHAQMERLVFQLMAEGKVIYRDRAYHFVG